MKLLKTGKFADTCCRSKSTWAQLASSYYFYDGLAAFINERAIIDAKAAKYVFGVRNGFSIYPLKLFFRDTAGAITYP